MNVGMNVVHRNEWLTAGLSKSLRKRDANQQTSDESRTLSYSDCIDGICLEIIGLQQISIHGAECNKMLSRGDFRYDATPFSVDIDLG
jgi:hypothetical protein